jgi:hypothetical protein
MAITQRQAAKTEKGECGLLVRVNIVCGLLKNERKLRHKREEAYSVERLGKRIKSAEGGCAT